MTDFNKIRQSDPKYTDMSDVEIGVSLHQSHYSDMPFEEFVSKTGLDPQDISIARSKRGTTGDYLIEQSVKQRPGEEPQARQERLYGKLPQDAVGSTGEGVARSYVQGGAVGHGDELVAAMAAAAAAVLSDDPLVQEGKTDFGQRYDAYVENERNKLGQFRDTNPVTAALTEIGGAIPTALATGGRAVTSPSMVGRMARGGAEGVALGSAYGFGTGEDTLDNRLESAKDVAMIAGPLGAVAPPVIGTLGAVKNSAKGAISAGIDKIPKLKGMFGSAGDQARSAKTVSDLVTSAKGGATSVKDELAQAAKEGQGEMMLADTLGVRGQRALSGLARSGGEGSEAITDALTSRQAGQSGRMGRAVSEAFDAPDTAAQRVDKLTSRRKKQADVNYPLARESASDVDVTAAVQKVDDIASPLRATLRKGDDNVSIDNINTTINRLGKSRQRPKPDTTLAVDSTDAALAGFRKRMITKGDQLTDFQSVLNLKGDVQDAAGAALRAGHNNKARQLDMLVKELDTTLETSSDAYRKANDTFAMQSRNMEAVGTGTEAARPSKRAADNIDTFKELTPRQQASFRAGYAGPLVAKIEGAATGANTARPLTSQKATQEIAEVARPGMGDRLNRQIGREQTMFETANRVTGGSKTADNLSDMAKFDPSVIVNILQGRPLRALAQGGQKTLNALKGENEATRDAIAKALLSTGDDAGRVIAKAVETGEKLSAKDQRLARILLGINVSQSAK